MRVKNEGRRGRARHRAMDTERQTRRKRREDGVIGERRSHETRRGNVTRGGEDTGEKKT